MVSQEMKTPVQIFLILLASVMAAVGQGWIMGTRGSALEAEKAGVSLETALGLENPIWVDARAEAAYDEKHFPGALHLNEDNWNSGLSELLEAWDPGRPIVVYCDGNGCATSRGLAMKLRKELNLDQVFWLEGGWQSIEERGAL